MNRLLNNWSLKVTALVLAIALWGHVRGEVNPLETTTFTVKLDADLPANWKLRGNPPPQNIRVTIRAPRLTLREIKGGLPTNPLASPDDAPLIGPRYLRAKVDFSALEAVRGTDVLPRSFPIDVDSDVEDAEVLGAKPSDCPLQLQQIVP